MKYFTDITNETKRHPFSLWTINTLELCLKASPGDLIGKNRGEKNTAAWCCQHLGFGSIFSTWTTQLPSLGRAQRGLNCPQPFLMHHLQLNSGSFYSPVPTAVAVNAGGLSDREKPLKTAFQNTKCLSERRQCCSLSPLKALKSWIWAPSSTHLVQGLMQRTKKQWDLFLI